MEFELEKPVLFLVQLTNDACHAAENMEVHIGRNRDRLKARVRRFKLEFLPFFPKGLDCSRVIDECNDNVAVICAWLLAYYDKVAIEDTLILHTLSDDAESEGLLAEVERLE